MITSVASRQFRPTSSIAAALVQLSKVGTGVVRAERERQQCAPRFLDDHQPVAGGASYDTPTIAADDGAATRTPTEEWNLGRRIRLDDGCLAAEAVGEALCRPTPQVEWDPYVACLARNDMELVTLHHPASRYWPFQWTEAGILLAGATALAMFLLVRVSRRPD
jgi:hypothetical protein